MSPDVIADLRRRGEALLAVANAIEFAIGLTVSGDVMRVQQRLPPPTKGVKRGRPTTDATDALVLGIVRDGFDKFPVIVTEAKAKASRVRAALRRLVDAGQVVGLGNTVTRRYEAAKKK